MTEQHARTDLNLSTRYQRFFFLTSNTHARTKIVVVAGRVKLKENSCGQKENSCMRARDQQVSNDRTTRTHRFKFKHPGPAIFFSRPTPTHAQIPHTQNPRIPPLHPVPHFLSPLSPSRRWMGASEQRLPGCHPGLVGYPAPVSSCL